MTEKEMKYSCPNVWKSYRAKKGAVTRIAKKSHHLRVLAQYTDYHDKRIESECIVELATADILQHGIWEAVQDALVKAKKIGEGSIEFFFSRVVGFDEWSHVTGEVNF